MAAAVLKAPFQRQRLAVNSPIPSTSSPRGKQTPDPSTASTDSSSNTFQRFRSSLEQSIRTATRSKKLPTPPTDEFATLTTKKDKGKRREEGTDDKEKINGLSRVTFRNKPGQEPPQPVPSLEGRVAGLTSYTTPSMRQGSMSSPALHMSSPKSHPAVPFSSPSNADGLGSPTRQRTKKVSLQPTSQEISAPIPLTKPASPKLTREPVSRHRSTKSHTPGLPPSPSTPTLPQSSRDREHPKPPRKERDLNTPPSTPMPRPHRSSAISPGSTRAASPIRTRSPSTRPRVVPPGLTSASTSHLPASSSPPPTPRKDSSRRASDTHRRPSVDIPRDSPRGASPSPVRPRAITPVQRSYAQNRHFNISSGSLISPVSNPEHRELIRAATSMLCKEVVKPPPHMARTDSGNKDWEEVEVRTRALARLERIWGKVSSSATASSSNVATAGLSSSGLSASGEEKERRLFCGALRDGYVLCQLLNKLRSANVVRPDAREDGFTRTSNVTKFLAACASHGLHNEDLFQHDDLIEATSESLARVAQTIIALIRFVDSPAPSRLKYISGQGQAKPTSPISIHPTSKSNSNGHLYSGGAGTHSRASASTPNLLNSPLSSSPSGNSPMRKRWTPPSDLPPVRSDSPAESNGAATSPGTSGGSPEPPAPRARHEEQSDVGNEAEFKPISVPQIMKPPPRSPLRKPSLKQLDAGVLLTWARSAASPKKSVASFTDSTRASVGDGSVRGSITQDGVYGRQSMASTMLSEDTSIITFTGVSSILDGGRSSSGGYGAGGNNSNQFGTIRTITTDMTSEPPSISKAEGSLIAEDIGRKRSVEMGLNFGGMVGGVGGGSKYGRDRKMSEAHLIDLSRVAEETDESVSSKGHTRNRPSASAATARGRTPLSNIHDKPMVPPAPAVHLRKGKWPDDFIDAFSSSPSNPPSAAAQELLADLQHHINEDASSWSPANPGPGPSSVPIPISTPRKLAVVGGGTPSRKGDGSFEVLSPFPRRPAHQPRRSLDTPPALLPKESLLRRDASPDSVSSSGRIVPRRHNGTPTSIGGGRLAPRAGRNLESPPNSSSDNDLPVPFPRSLSGARGTGTPSPRSSGTEVVSNDRLVRPLRGRFHSEVEGSSTRRKARPSSYDEMGAQPSRSRFESMVNLGAASGVTSASDLMTRDSVDGSAVRMRLVVREDGKPPTHFQLGNCIGRGQFGSVYRALNLNTGQMVAVKRIRLEGLKEEEVTTLMREVDLVKSLSHPSIVKYEGMARDEDSLNIVLEYVENGSLGQTLRAFGKLNERLVASYVVKILEGLHYLHTSDVVHCDLKAANILTTKNGNVKLSDFGVSLNLRNLRAMEEEIKDVAGTPNWMAPEVIELKGASTKSDIWSLGCTVVELLTGRPPYADIANSMSVMFRIVEDQMPPIPEGCSDLLKDFLGQCFNKEPARRPSAELLCEHPWLRKNLVLKELRPQDSIPFLRRVSTELQRSDAARYLSQIEMPESPVSASPKRDMGKIAPIGRRTSNPSFRPLDNDISPREHSFVKTIVSKPMVCRVCLENVKKTAKLCSQCSLISHDKCTTNAPPTCDLRAQLLLYAQYAEKGNPASVYSNPADILNDISQNVAMSDIPFVTHDTPRNSIDAPLPPRSPADANSTEHTPTAFKFMAAFRRSRTNLSLDPVAGSSKDVEDTVPVIRKRPSVLHKTRQERPLSMTSDSTGMSSLRSAATAAESFSSRQNTGGRSHLSGGGDSSRSKPPVSDGAALDRGKTSKVIPSAFSEPTADYDDGQSYLPGSLPSDPRRQRKKGSKQPGNCTVQ